MERANMMYEAIKHKILDLEVDPVQPIEEKSLVRDTGGSLTLIRQALNSKTDISFGHRLQS